MKQLFSLHKRSEKSSNFTDIPNNLFKRIQRKKRGLRNDDGYWSPESALTRVSDVVWL